MKINEDNKRLLYYMSMAPLALAFERYLECRIYQDLEIVRPVLDMGCGDGLFAHVLFEDKIDTGIDLNSRELERAGKLNGYNELVMCRADAIPKPNGAYKTIFSNSVLEHISDLSSVFKEAHRLLAPGGRFYITAPASEFEYYTIANTVLTFLGMRQLAARYRSFCSRIIWRQMHYKSIESWKRLAKEHGFGVADVYTYDPKPICLLNDFLYPFGILAVINKRLFNRWTLVPAIRRLIIYPVYIIVKRLLNNSVRVDRGGLVFLSLKKAGDI